MSLFDLGSSLKKDNSFIDSYRLSTFFYPVSAQFSSKPPFIYPGIAKAPPILVTAAPATGDPNIDTAAPAAKDPYYIKLDLI